MTDLLALDIATTWRPIETAPKDGTLVLLYVPGSAIMEIVFGRYDIDGDDGDWLMDWGNQGTVIDIPVTHWMPMPEPPK
jgi:Protein of unknown function (DUF551)